MLLLSSMSLQTLNADDSQHYISSSDPLPELQTCISSFLLNISIGHLKVNKPQMEL